MYLNMINNFKHESKRKSGIEENTSDHDKDDVNNKSRQIVDDNDNFLYYSVFYGDLTKNWIQLKH